MRVDEARGRELIQRQNEWAKKGVRAGSGKQFAPISDRPNTFAGGFGTPVTASGGFGRLNLNTDSKPAKKKTKRKGEPVGNPHAVALAQLANNPTLRTGGIVQGRRIPASHEHWEQVLVFDWLYRVQPDYYDDFSAVPMGGLRNTKTAISLMAEGAKSGYPDIVCDVPMGVYHGLFIEMKWGGNKPTDIQIKTLNRKTERGYFACVCYSHNEAIEVITEYLTLAAGGVMTWAKNTDLWLGVTA